jgi:hypothetical protein
MQKLQASLQPFPSTVLLGAFSFYYFSTLDLDYLMFTLRSQNFAPIGMFLLKIMVWLILRGSEFVNNNISFIRY